MGYATSKSLMAHIAVFSANLIYGINYSVAKDVMPSYLEPFAFILLRVLGAGLLFWTASLFIKEKIERQDLLTLVKCGVFGVAVNQLLFFQGLSLTVPINASLIMTTNPIQVTLLAYIFLSEKITPLKFVGLWLGLLGAVLIIIYGKSITMNNSTTMGDIFIFINSLSYAYFIIIAKPLLRKYHPVTLMKYTFLFGSVLVIPCGLTQIGHVPWHAFTNVVWCKVAFVVIVVTCIAYWLNTFALRHLSSSTVSIYIYSQPLFASLVSIMAGHGMPQLVHLVAGFMIFTGVFLVGYNRPSKV